MMQQLQSVCSDCHGEGELFNDTDKCKTCNGKRVVNETKILEVHVDKGMREGEKIMFRGEGDQQPNVEPGDVIIVIQLKPHEKFERSGSDLYMAHSVTLTEALCGFSMLLKHLDGRQLVIRSKPGEVIVPGTTKGVKGEGMPTYRNPYEKGNLYIKFNVEFPESYFTSSENIQALEALLPPRTPVEPFDLTDENVEEVNLHDYEPTTGGTNGAMQRDDDSDGDEQGRHPGVQCASH
jgi:DnaJ family protein A protein 2